MDGLVLIKVVAFAYYRQTNLLFMDVCPIKQKFCPETLTFCLVTVIICPIKLEICLVNLKNCPIKKVPT
jgi:hypothetical protein